jgi:hypothetical protein
LNPGQMQPIVTLALRPLAPADNHRRESHLR